MLILCPECQLQISDKAISCPHCGYPLKPEKAVKQPRTKRMRLPNVDEYAIKRLVGHSITDLTEAVYTIRGVDWLREEIEKIRRC